MDFEAFPSYKIKHLNNIKYFLFFDLKRRTLIKNTSGLTSFYYGGEILKW